MPSFGHGHRNATSTRRSRTNAACALHLQGLGRHRLFAASEPHVARVPLPVPRDRKLIPLRSPAQHKLGVMIPAAVCPRVTLTIQISEVLYDALQVAAVMSQTTVPAFIGSVLRESQVTFFADSGESLSDVVVLDVRETPPPASTRGDLGPLQRAVLDHLLDAPTMSGVYDLGELRRAMLRSHHGPAVSRAVHRLVELGVLVPMTPTSNGFQPDLGGAESRVRFVRRGAGS